MFDIYNHLAVAGLIYCILCAIFVFSWMIYGFDNEILAYLFLHSVFLTLLVMFFIEIFLWSIMYLNNELVFPV